MVAACHIDADGKVSPGFRPMWMVPTGQPQPHGADETGRAVAAYVEDISRRAGFKTAFEWDGDRVVFGPA
jgi:poly-gamma-glutamate synthesis protein (capsule biosynthesis protein)